MFFGCRNNLIAIVNIVRKRNQKHNKEKLNTEEVGESYDDEEENPFTNKQSRIQRANREYYVITILLNIVMIAASVVLQNIELVFNFLGAVC